MVVQSDRCEVFVASTIQTSAAARSQKSVFTLKPDGQIRFMSDSGLLRVAIKSLKLRSASVLVHAITIEAGLNLNAIANSRSDC